MSRDARIPWAAAATIAKQLVGELEPFVRRVKTVGSVRRQRPEVGDIEILIEPLVTNVGLFAEEVPDLDAIRTVAHRWGTFGRAGDRTIQVITAEGFAIELYICHPPAQWGSLLAIRTGPWNLGKHAMTCLLNRGMRHTEGHIRTEEGRIVPTPTEEDFFAAAGLPCLPPRHRDTPAAFRALEEVRCG